MVNELLKQILDELKDLKSDVSDLKDNQVKMQEDIGELKQGQTRLERKLDELSNKLDDLEAKNAQRHIEIDSKLNEIIDDVEFIKHKEFKNEEDIFKLKKKLVG